MNDPALRGSVIRGLAGFDRSEVGNVLLRLYSQLSDPEKLDAISTLTAREKTALALVKAVDAGKIEKRDLSEFDIRQLQRFKEPKLKELVNKLFGAKPSSAERAQQIAEGAKPLVSLDGMFTSHPEFCWKVAEKEVFEKKLPFIIHRRMPDGVSEYWSAQELSVMW
jgi:DNA-directed RNA polymerase subunit K/omega